MIGETNKDCIDAAQQQAIADELTRISQTYRKTHPNSENSYQIEALVFKQLGMFDKQKEVLQTALKQSFAAPRCAIMLADIEFREHDYDKSLLNFQKAIAESNKMKTAVHDGYLHVMTALCKIASAKQKNVDLTEGDVLDIYDDFNVALSFTDGLGANYKEILAKKTSSLIEKYNVPVPEKNKKLNEFMTEIKEG